MIPGILTSLAFGFFYVIGAIPAGVAAHAPVWMAALAAWLGYSLGGTAVLLAGAPLRKWLMARLRIDPQPDPSKLFWRMWNRFGLWGLALIAPVTVGPQATAAVALALGESPRRIQLAISLCIVPWVLLFAMITALGAHGLHALK